jgi:hypothetical protein
VPNGPQGAQPAPPAAPPASPPAAAPSKSAEHRVTSAVCGGNPHEYQTRLTGSLSHADKDTLNECFCLVWGFGSGAYRADGRWQCAPRADGKQDCYRFGPGGSTTNMCDGTTQQAQASKPPPAKPATAPPPEQPRQPSAPPQEAKPAPPAPPPPSPPITDGLPPPDRSAEDIIREAHERDRAIQEAQRRAQEEIDHARQIAIDAMRAAQASAQAAAQPPAPPVREYAAPPSGSYQAGPDRPDRPMSQSNSGRSLGEAMSDAFSGIVHGLDRAVTSKIH